LVGDMGAGAGVPKEVTVSSSVSSRGSMFSSSSERDFMQTSQDMLQDLSFQDLSRKFADARHKLRHYDCAKADQRLIECMNERRALNEKSRRRKSLARQSRSVSVLVKSCDIEQQCMSPLHTRGSQVVFD